MADRPISFSAPMVLAVLAGRKTQTRQILKPRRGVTIADFVDAGPAPSSVGRRLECPKDKLDVRFAIKDRLWVREPWSHAGIGVWAVSTARMVGPGGVIYRTAYANDSGIGWWSSSQMPREFSRLTLDVTAVRVERVQDISCADAIAEGVAPAANSQTIDCDTRDPRDGFCALWTSLHGLNAWGENPWVAVLEFSARHGNIDALDRQPAASALPLSQEAR